MDKRYILKYKDNKCIEISEPNSSVLVFKLPYKELKNRSHNIQIENRFIVYILHQKSISGKDNIYVGKSKNGIDNRPTSHDDRNSKWTDCYVLTNHKENTFLHDGAVQYIENAICEIVNSLDSVYNNTTRQTNAETVNQYERSYCDDYVAKSLDMLYVLGLDLFPQEMEEDIQPANVHTIKPRMMNLYNELVEKTHQLNQDIVFTATKTYIKTTLDDKNLFAVECFNTSMIICFNAKKGKLDDSEHLLEDVSKIGHHGPGDYRIKISDNSLLGEIMDFANQVINL